jgi:hypothetical protein
VLPPPAGEGVLVPGQGAQLRCEWLRGPSPSLAAPGHHGGLCHDRAGLQGIGEEKAQVHLCREEVRVEVADKTNRLHTLSVWGALVTLVTYAAAGRTGLKRVKHPTSEVARLSGGCTVVEFHYMVPVVDGEDRVRIVKAMGVDSIAALGATDVPADIEKMFPQTKGWGNKLVRPA